MVASASHAQRCHEHEHQGLRYEKPFQHFWEDTTLLAKMKRGAYLVNLPKGIPNSTAFET
jgi:hypothetical protein